MLLGAKNEKSQPSHGSGGIPTATSLRMPPASGCHQPPDATSLQMLPASGCHQPWNDTSFREPTATSFWKLTTTASG